MTQLVAHKILPKLPPRMTSLTVTSLDSPTCWDINNSSSCEVYSRSAVCLEFSQITIMFLTITNTLDVLLDIRM